MKKILITALILLVFPASAQGIMLVNPDGSVAEPFQAWVDRYTFPLIGVFEIRYATDVCGIGRPVSGCTSPAGWVGIEPKSCHGKVGVRGWRWCRFVLFHELGHQFDYQMKAELRVKFASLVGLSNAPWAAVKESFANAFAHCFLGRTVLLNRWRSSSVFQQFRGGDLHRICPEVVGISYAARPK